MNCTDIEERDNCEIVYVHGSVVSVLARFLDIAVPWIWILGHRPNQYMQWWQTSIALNTNDTSYYGMVRDVGYDLQLPTDEFVSRVSAFDKHGIELIQSHQQMPDTLSLDSIPDSQQNQVLIQNGATLRIYLPHAIETAQVQSFTKGYLATIIDT